MAADRPGPLSSGGKPLALKEAKPLPSSSYGRWRRL